MSLKISSSLFEDELKSSFLNEDLEEYIENVEKIKLQRRKLYLYTQMPKGFHDAFHLKYYILP
jgi:hypothetical protein